MLGSNNPYTRSITVEKNQTVYLCHKEDSGSKDAQGSFTAENAGAYVVKGPALGPCKR